MFSTKYDEEIKEWSGKNVLPSYNPEISLAQVLLERMKTYGSKIAQVSTKSNIKENQSHVINYSFVLDKR